jgi:hypothetical protein
VVCTRPEDRTTPNCRTVASPQKKSPPLTERLGLLRRVDAGKADPVLLPVAVEQGDCVAISNEHHAALEKLRPNGRAPEC